MGIGKNVIPVWAGRLLGSSYNKSKNCQAGLGGETVRLALTEGEILGQPGKGEQAGPGLVLAKGESWTSLGSGNIEPVWDRGAPGLAWVEGLLG